MYQEYFNYYLELERDFFATEPYLTIDEDNYNAFSIQYNRIYQSICSEIDCLLKELCKQLEVGCKARKLGDYQPIIQSRFKYFNFEKVYFYKSKIELQPWKEWKEDKAPFWWTMYNNVKHHRMEKYKETEKPYYKYANLENVLNALAALFIVEQYYIYSYDFTKEFQVTETMVLNSHVTDGEIARRKENALLENISRKCCMKDWQDAGCYTGFMGQSFFEFKNLEKVLENRNI